MSDVLTPSEAASMYRQAKDQRQQIIILSQLMQTSVAGVIELLTSQGETVDGRWFPRKRTNTKTTEELQTAPATSASYPTCRAGVVSGVQIGQPLPVHLL